MSVEVLLITCAFIAAFGGAAVGFFFGRWFGRHELLRQLFEAKDQELWIAGHYLSVDLRERTKPHKKGQQSCPSSPKP